MNRKWTYFLAALAAGLLALAGTGCEKLRARDQLNKGVQSFKNAKYPEAVERFKEAVRLDPTFQTARLYLGAAYMSQYIPGVPSEENERNAKAAKETFAEVLATEPRNEVAIESMASLNFNEAQALSDLGEKVKKLEEAQKWYKDLSVVNPKKKEAFYSLGVIAWTKGYAALGQARNKIGMRPEEPGPLKDKKVREELKVVYMTVITDGIQNLMTSLDIDKNYDDAMAYLNLLYRQRADLDDTPEEAKKDTVTADSWLERAMEARKVKAGALPASVSGS
jgi:tetratricopeptide (TPR) repeat protein